MTSPTERCAQSGSGVTHWHNPYNLYAKLIGLTTGTAGGGTTTDPAAAELLASRKSVNDLVRAELNSLLALPALSAADKQRLQQHFDSIRDAEIKMGEMGMACSQDGLATSQIEASPASPSRWTA